MSGRLLKVGWVLLLLNIARLARLSSAHRVPILRDLGVIVKDPAACVRDPTLVLNVNGTWHFWATHNPYCTDRHNFPRASVHHYFSNGPDITGLWNTSGEAIGFGDAGAWDAWSVFTPGAYYDADAAGGKGLWYLWYGAVADGSRPTRESIGLATASSPFGPWTRSAHNPVFDGNDTAWCGPEQSARVDEAIGYEIEGRKVVVVKGVCKNFTALPSVWVSKPNPANQSSFDPPYYLLPGAAPMASAFDTAKSKGFEHQQLFPGPDSLLHMTGHDHGDQGVSHYVSEGGVAANSWRRLANIKSFGLPMHEPTTVFAGPPGDRGGIPQHFIQFARDPEGGRLVVHLMSVTWANASSSAYPAL
jgi:hypothetical protein